MKRKLMIIGCVAMILSIAFILVPGEIGVLTARALEPTPAEMTDLNNLDQLKEPFMRDRDTIGTAKNLPARPGRRRSAACELVGGGDIDARPHRFSVSHPLSPN